MTFKKWQKPPKKWQKMSEITIEEEIKVEEPTVIEEETPVSTVIENEITNEEAPKRRKSKKGTEEKVIWTIGDTVVAKPKGRICFEAQVAPVPMFKLPADIRRYLVNHGFSSDVYKRDKERLEKHWADMEMINKLKDFLTSMN